MTHITAAVSLPVSSFDWKLNKTNVQIVFSTLLLAPPDCFFVKHWLRPSLKHKKTLKYLTLLYRHLGTAIAPPVTSDQCYKSYLKISLEAVALLLKKRDLEQ
jgi:hypothetical protein